MEVDELLRYQGVLFQYQKLVMQASERVTQNAFEQFTIKETMDMMRTIPVGLPIGVYRLTLNRDKHPTPQKKQREIQTV